MQGVGYDNTSVHAFVAYSSDGTVWNGAYFEAWDDTHFTTYALTANRLGTSREYVSAEPAPAGTARYELWKYTGTLATSSPVWWGDAEEEAEDAAGSSSSVTTKVIRFAHRIAGVLTNATSVTLNDDTATYGVRRADTGAVVVAAGTALAHDGTGLYSYTLTGLTVGVTYQFSVTKVYAGETQRWAGTFVAGGAMFTAYGTQGEIEMEYGKDSCAADADLSNTGAGVAAVWAMKGNDAASYINWRASVFGYVVPIAETTTDQFNRLKVAWRKLVRAALNEARGWTQTQAPGTADVSGVYKNLRAEALAEIDNVLRGSPPFTKVTTGDLAPASPGSIAPSCDRYGFPVRTTANPWPVMPWGYG